MNILYEYTIPEALIISGHTRAVRSDGATVLEPGLSILRPNHILRNFRHETFPKLLKIFRKGVPQISNVNLHHRNPGHHFCRLRVASCRPA